MVVLIVGLMVWRHVAEERLVLPARAVWKPDRSPFPGLEAFTEEDSAMFFGRDREIAELLERLHPVVAAGANRLIAVVGPSGAGNHRWFRREWCRVCGSVVVAGSSCQPWCLETVRCAASL
jgi:hypothetical protein